MINPAVRYREHIERITEELMKTFKTQLFLVLPPNMQKQFMVAVADNVMTSTVASMLQYLKNLDTKNDEIIDMIHRLHDSLLYHFEGQPTEKQ